MTPPHSPRRGPRRGRGRATAGVAAEPVRLRIEALGAQGDGVARRDGTEYYVAGTLPGDEVVALPTARRGQGVAARVVEALGGAQDHRPPACAHVGSCGACLVQHAPDDLYLAWKTGLVAAALARRGFRDPPLAPLRTVPPGSRRRAALRGIRVGGRVRLGFNRRHSDQVVPIDTCPLLTPALNALLAAAGDLPVVPRRAVASDVEGGLDLVLDLADAPDLGLRQKLAAFAGRAGVARLSWRQGGEAPELLAQLADPVVRIAGVPVVLPPGGFLQPSAEGEALLTAAVARGLGAARTIADLFGGIGTFGLALADRARVQVFEVDVAAVAALRHAAGRAGLGGRVGADCRDLDQRPLTARELEKFDAAVFDPPRAGAAAQAAEMAAAGGLATVVAVSCNPATFARDARTLVDGGFRLRQVTPVDQFPWSAHLEVVGEFVR
ncbi:MAG: class I SAM-dependent RNA methyltransferase [Hyphomicrobiales bacterium]|nr:class I SAM-dependent RNA methyltransferase [Hyphomicrobiales bacterium]